MATESLPQEDELMTTSSFVMLKASQLSFSFVFGHSAEPETGKEKSEDRYQTPIGGLEVAVGSGW